VKKPPRRNNVGETGDHGRRLAKRAKKRTRDICQQRENQRKLRRGKNCLKQGTGCEITGKALGEQLKNTEG